MEVSEIIAWCRDKDVGLDKVIILSNVPTDCEDRVIYNVLDTALGVGKCKVLGCRLDKNKEFQFVLIEFDDDISKTSIPAEIGGPEVGLWYTQVVCVAAEAPKKSKEDEFQTKLNLFLQNEGKSLADISSLASPAPDLNTKLVEAINSLVQTCHVASSEERGIYRKLRPFSGFIPTPLGEDEFEIWVEQTTHILEEWQCSDNVKKQKLVECLRGPAADIVRFEKTGNSAATYSDYLSVLESAFGSTEDAADLMLKFRSTYQNEGEKLSAYILRLDRLLHSMLRKKGIEYSALNHLRMQQIVRGALAGDMVAMRLRMTHKLCEPPSFNELMKEVREEENMVSSRRTLPSNVAMSVVPTTKKDSSANSGTVDSEVEKLKKEIRGLKNEVSRLSAAAKEPVAHDRPAMHSLAAVADFKTPTRTVTKANIFCYRCGEDGHLKRDCKNDENLRKVNQRLIRMRQSSGNFSGAQ
ncbi:paraneoplastic antigen Ma1 homolog [Danio rerio]|uniref:Paraneoplastic antigen Ma1 homolog n=1 Tax=Danio rerio TaxID=7955 RepID=A0AC58IYJ2_DANRE|nr:paraneoplastic antigen Ma1 homolog [Danio rerio]|eukprot:XP_021326303.1 paraneoplastic antigen Ma1 homolog [Danio rerio]